MVYSNLCLVMFYDWRDSMIWTDWLAFATSSVTRANPRPCFPGTGRFTRGVECQ